MKAKALAPCSIFAAQLLIISLPLAAAPPRKIRTFEFTYGVKVEGFPESARNVRIWIPLAQSDRHQIVRLIKDSGSVPLRSTRENEYGNRMLYAEVRDPRAPLDFLIEYRVARREYRMGNFKSLMRYNSDPVTTTPELERFLEPDRMIQINGEIARIAARTTQGKTGVIERAYAIYNYVFHNMRYEKVGTGWGRGDALWACNSHHGNCTDFHSLFIGMMRAQKIPARFVIGFPLPPHRSEGVIPGYHCWAEFYLTHVGWVPVDISEA